MLEVRRRGLSLVDSGLAQHADDKVPEVLQEGRPGVLRLPGEEDVGVRPATGRLALGEEPAEQEKSYDEANRF